ncbi:ShKT domain-containing protein [Aphelenchoides bicaudatus]|nr:ShKT domain-containing protein [Aphelenchoides bicaudatus]
MDKNLKITLLVVAFAVLLQYSTILAAYVCPSPAIDVGGNKICPPSSTYNTTADRCCMTVPDVPGGNGSYCNLPAMLPGGGVKCPTTHPYDATKMQCCGPNPITQTEIDAARQNATRSGNNSTASTCEDKTVQGKLSDCPANANLCNNTLYYTLMTEQCPKTCGRCPAAGTNTASASSVPGTRGKGCVDGTNAKGGSDCPQNAFR